MIILPKVIPQHISPQTAVRLSHRTTHTHKKKKTPFLDFRDYISASLQIIQAFSMVVRGLSPRDKRETADLEPMRVAHMMLIDRCLPSVSHTESRVRLAPPAGHHYTTTGAATQSAPDKSSIFKHLKKK